MLGSPGSMATAPIALLGRKSVSGSHEAPPLTDFQTPPLLVAMYKVTLSPPVESMAMSTTSPEFGPIPWKIWSFWIRSGAGPMGLHRPAPANGRRSRSSIPKRHKVGFVAPVVSNCLKASASGGDSRSVSPFLGSSSAMFLRPCLVLRDGSDLQPALLSF